MEEYVLVLDFGSQYTQLIARRIRECEVYSEIRPHSTQVADLGDAKPTAIILSGGPAGVLEEDAPSIEPAWFELGVPILGLCYGMQLSAHLLGGQVKAGQSREYGPAEIEIHQTDDLFQGFSQGEKTHVWMSHGDLVVKLPPGFSLLASSVEGPIAAFGDSARRIFCIQFHPEVVHTPRGKEILRNFLFDISGCQGTWNSSSFIEECVKEIAVTVGSNRVVCGLSGGVDSTVAACLVHQAIGDQLKCVLVDNGLLRQGEAHQVMTRLGTQSGGLGLNITLVDAAERFLTALQGVTDPEEKRKIIGHEFIGVFEAETTGAKNVTHLVQGTLYPDVIESVSVKGPSATIKTHHNVGGLPERMKLKLIEPFRELFKDEVRSIGRQLGIAQDILGRHPFPGPGLAVRILGEITPERIHLVQQADAIFLEEIKATGVYDELWQAFAVLLPVKSVGVMGDGRTYEQVIALRAVCSEDGMTADWNYLPEELLRRTSRRIINEVKGVNRVVLDISSKPPATIEWE